jgi:hypothetical protein
VLRLGILPRATSTPEKRGSIAQAQPVGAPENNESVKHSESNDAQHRIVDDANQIKGLDKPRVDGLLPDADLSLAVKATWSVMCSADEQVERLEQRVTERVKLRAQFSFLKTVPRIGQILALSGFPPDCES